MRFSGTSLVRSRAMKLFALAGILAVVLLATCSAAQAETVDLGYKQATGPYPSVFFAPATLERAESFEVLVTANPVQELEYAHYVSCTRGSETVSTQTPDQLVTPPYSTTILPTLPEPDSCWIDVSAETPFKGSKEGTVRIEATGTRRPPPPPPPVEPVPASYWTTCSLPIWLRSGEVKVHGTIACSRGKAIATSAWRKPIRDGSSVRSRGYSCRRNELRGGATVRCARGRTIIRLTGKLR